MMANGNKENATAKVSGRVLTPTCTLEIGNVIEPMATEHIPGPTVTDMMESGQADVAKVAAKISLRMATPTLVYTARVCLMVKVSILGKMDQSMTAHFKMDSSTEKETGGRIKIISKVIDTLVAIRAIRRMASENSFGLAATHIKAIIKTMNVMARARCCLRMEPNTKGIGQTAYKTEKGPLNYLTEQ